jgi:hypothetical protein
MGRVCVCLNATDLFLVPIARFKHFACHSLDMLGDAYGFQMLVIHFSSMDMKILILFCYVTDCREQVL